MAFSLTPKELEKELESLLAEGVFGNANDFFRWVRMQVLRKFKQEPRITQGDVEAILESWKAKGTVITSKFDDHEYHLSESSPLFKKPVLRESYSILGSLEYSPLQYVKSRLESFLRKNKVLEDEIIDISIATLEAVENAVKYGDGDIDVEYSLDKEGNFNIVLLNKIKEFNLQDDIKRGKFSSTATLMRGMMVMQKLFHRVDLDILEDNKKAKFQAYRKVTFRQD